MTLYTRMLWMRKTPIANYGKTSTRISKGLTVNEKVLICST